MKEILIATRNEGKARDFKHLLEAEGIVVKTLLDFEEFLDVVEDKETLAGNALKKAKEISERFNIPVLADDSGLMIDALDGRPGVFTARYAEKENDLANMAKVIRELKALGLTASKAHFMCVLAFVEPGGYPVFFKGTCDGEVLTDLRGTGGFGYDRVFYVPELGKTLAEITLEEKNKLSHRSKALASFMTYVKATLA